MRQQAARWLALGDSYTAAEGIAWNDGWPARLTSRLRQAGFAVADPRVIARTGWTCDELLDALRAERRALEADAPWDLVTLLAGVNDQYRGRKVPAWRPHYVALLAAARRLAGDRPQRVVALSVPDWGVTPFAGERDRSAIAAAIDEVNAEQRRLAAAAGAGWVEVTDLARDHRGPEQVAPDGLHPSGAMYARWVERLLPVARQILGTAAPGAMVDRSR